MVARIHFGKHFFDLAVGADQIADAFGAAALGIVGGAVGNSNLAFGIAEQREIKMELLRKRAVLFHRIKADAENFNVQLLILAGSVAEPATLGRSTRGVRLGIKPQQHAAAPERRQCHRFTGVCLHFKIGRQISHV